MSTRVQTTLNRIAGLRHESIGTPEHSAPQCTLKMDFETHLLPNSRTGTPVYCLLERVSLVKTETQSPPSKSEGPTDKLLHWRGPTRTPWTPTVTTPQRCCGPVGRSNPLARGSATRDAGGGVHNNPDELSHPG